MNDKTCDVCGMTEPEWWWLSDEINPVIRNQLTNNRQMRVNEHYPSMWAALDAWGQTKGLENGNLQDQT